MNIKLKKIADDVKTPTKAHSTDACFDIYAYSPDWEIILDPGQTRPIRTGFVTEIPTGYYAAIYARSGLGIKQGLRPANCVGIIDSDYRGEWIVALHNDSDSERTISHGDRIAQFIINEVIPCEIIEEQNLSETARGSGGFGSSGK